MISNLQGKESHSFAEFLERRSDDRFTGNNTMTTHPDTEMVMGLFGIEKVAKLRQDPSIKSIISPRR